MCLYVSMSLCLYVSMSLCLSVCMNRCMNEYMNECVCFSDRTSKSDLPADEFGWSDVESPNAWGVLYIQNDSNLGQLWKKKHIEPAIMGNNEQLLEYRLCNGTYQHHLQPMEESQNCQEFSHSRFGLRWGSVCKCSNRLDNSSTNALLETDHRQ